MVEIYRIAAPDSTNFFNPHQCFSWVNGWSLELWRAKIDKKRSKLKPNIDEKSHFIVIFELMEKCGVKSVEKRSNSPIYLTTQTKNPKDNLLSNNFLLRLIFYWKMNWNDKEKWKTPCSVFLVLSFSSEKKGVWGLCCVFLPFFFVIIIFNEKERKKLIVTWLILPVVICLSQRLSHACLSINNFILWNCEWLIKSVIVYLIVLTTWITVVILELIHAKRPDFWKGCIY